MGLSRYLAAGVALLALMAVGWGWMQHRTAASLRIELSAAQARAQRAERTSVAMSEHLEQLRGQAVAADRLRAQIEGQDDETTLPDWFGDVLDRLRRDNAGAGDNP